MFAVSGELPSLISLLGAPPQTPIIGSQSALDVRPAHIFDAETLPEHLQRVAVAKYRAQNAFTAGRQLVTSLTTSPDLTRD